MAYLVLFFAYICVAWIVRRVTGKTWGRSLLWTLAGCLALFLLAGVVLALLDWAGVITLE